MIPLPSKKLNKRYMWLKIDVVLLKITSRRIANKWLRSSKYILADMNCNYDLSMESHLTNLFIDIFVFKMTKLSAV